MSYPASSPYFTTGITANKYLDIMINRPIASDPADIYWTITPTYTLRPDLLAYDLYSNSRLWWVFAQRNPNTLKDPLFDFVQGVKIYIPQFQLISKSLGL